MPSKINLSEKEKENIIADIIQQLQTTLSGNFEGNEKLTLQIPKMETVKITKKPKIIISTTAGLKMSELVRNCTAEVGWHGFVERPDKNTFLITDIVVYPQTVTSTTVTTDETEYAIWCSNIKTADLRKMRFQGHSHVNMQCNPSGTDLVLYNNYLANLTNDDYYIFFICNKRGDINAFLYDMHTNTKYTKEDLEIIKETDMSEWFESVKENIKTSKPAATPSNFNSDKYNSYGQRYGNYYGHSNYRYNCFDDMEFETDNYERHYYGTFDNKKTTESKPTKSTKTTKPAKTTKGGKK